MTLINLAKFHADFALQMASIRQHDLTSQMLVRVLFFCRIGFVLHSILFGVWLVKMLVRPKPNFNMDPASSPSHPGGMNSLNQELAGLRFKKYDRYYFLWQISMALITSFSNFSLPGWYIGVLASQLPGLFLYYLIVPQHNLWFRIIPNLFFTGIQLILFALDQSKPPLIGFISVYTSYILTNIVGIVYSHRFYINERRNFALLRKKDRLTAKLSADKRQLQQEKELVAHYEAELRKQEVQREKIKALQAQIKPHFLSNSLSTIAFYCRTDSGLAYKLVNDLAVYLQSTFALQSQTIPWEEELRLVRAYLSIEAARMENRLSFSIEESGNLDECHLPPFTLQPLVENAIRHGLAPLPDGGTLTIIARETPEHYYFAVKDNGQGFDPSQKPNFVPKQDRTPGGIGLSNIEERLQGIYGCGLRIESRRGAGTLISFRIPKQKH
ncbi:MAG TPA: hypothetical protein DDW65_03830 [Firmicutes bacterium]|jgi:sensor histidine kinase YesM|nr:hypothetical protein [Bacillota bacterium]